MNGKKEKGRQAWTRGIKAERLAAWWLRLKGYRVLAERFKTPVGEIDLVVRRGDTIVFVEVKARADWRDAVQSIDGRQRHRIQRAAEVFLKNHPGADARFDVIALGRAGWPRHLVDAWRPEN